MSNATRNMKIATNYRVKEPICNFKFRVKIVQQKLLLAELLENEGDTRDTNFLEEEEHVFSWQEKVFSPFEVSFYSDEKNCLTEHQKEYHRRIKEENIQGSQLYSYTKYDSYYPDDELLTKRCKTKLSIRNQSALPTLQNRKPFSERYNKKVIDERPDDIRIQSNHFVYTKRSTMYVMVDLSQKDKTLVSCDDDLQTVLCKVTYDEIHRILTVNPDFTDERCYAVVNSSGVKFNYWIEHVSEKQSSRELQQHQNDLRREIKEQLMQRESQISHGLQLPPSSVRRVFVKLDIMSAHEFSFDGLFVSYCIDLPEHWSTSQKEKLFGRTQRCNLQNKSAYFSYATDILLDFQSISTPEIMKISPLWPRLLLSVASLDKWTRYRTEGYAALSLPLVSGSYKFNVPTWRATGGIINSLRRFFTGGTYELEDITYCGIPLGHEGTILNKTNLKVVSSGYIKININIVHQSHASLESSFQGNYFQKLNTDTLMDNIESIFEQFKAARERMIQIRNLNI